MLSKITVWGFYCLRCGHRWVPRGLPQKFRAKSTTEKLATTDPGPEPVYVEAEPRVCPACKSPYWNVVKGKPSTATSE